MAGAPRRRGERLTGGALSLTALTLIVGLWALASRWVDAVLILPPPRQVGRAFFSLLAERDFWLAVAHTFYRGVAGFGISFAVGGVVGVAAGLSLPIHTLFKPIIAVIRATPVMSVVLIALLWFRTGTVPIFSTFLIAFPVIVQNVITGIKQTDPKLKEMAVSFGLPPQRRLSAVYIPSILPYVVAGARTALGLTWKVVVAAEVLSIPTYGVGSEMQLSQMSLETAMVFAWTVAAILLSAFSQGLFSLVLNLFPWSREHGHSL
ncbi:MAG TPA: ABC transporter permease subunit [Sediminispirochaeta sp.]|nr:ABC transporter permease subunit [Sediminispirochaeta sp.]